MATYLDEILASHRERARAHAAGPAEVGDAPPVRSFCGALRSGDGLAVIAEVKRRSPSKGVLVADLDPAEVAADYERGGASCLSVLTDERFFGGSADDLAAARGACGLPVLRKDFTVAMSDVFDARRMGADCILLIVAALHDAELTELHDQATLLGMDALVEVHDESELERALRAGAGLIGVNQRDLITFEVDRDRAARLAPHIPERVIKVAESGVRDADDAGRLHDAGYDAVLVGESVVTAGDRAAAVRAMRGA